LRPEIEEFVEHGKCRAEIVILQDIALQQPGVIRPPVENVGCGQPIAFNLPPKVLRHHGPLHPITGDVSRLSSPLQASKLTKLFTFKATVPLLATSSAECQKIFEQLLQAKNHALMSPPSGQLGGKISEFPKPFWLPPRSHSPAIFSIS